MPRKLKTFITSIGFYDLAIAAPSMKAALEAWGSPQNLFHLNLAEETRDEDIIAAAMDRPGVVLRRAVGTNARYQEKAEPPRTIAGNAPLRGAAKTSTPRKRTSEPPAQAHRATILQFEKARAKRERDRRLAEAERNKEQAAVDREAVKRAKAVAKERSTLEKARARHQAQIEKLEADRQALDDRIEDARQHWREEEKALETRIRQADP